MKLIVAGSKKDYDEGLTVRGLIEAEDVDNPLYVSVTVNDEFVKSEEFDSFKLKDGDEVEFLYFMGGGR
ncbi:MAG: sulfur carrier protein ThiS [Lachnospiraceae bacterium]|jgi:sulfur carrier protein|uniref:sulfur carrier protein ThiS n=1 Tax=Clostridium sp. (strain SY8519) TaxID=1042156 RepID=UPI00021719E9|nr:sulfur carrier protein ThiS [Clostridium sp. SY8519]MCI1655257.1 sulfur carrier protein ThiS [Lachnospiraceae bacterium]MCI1656393.1 sulfur carrier protein ThiS [Lachnospiraceae bacterium]MCI2194875.1 sulfur carrier protein ThiS [Lachnospiraceae bacterium]BAK47487.1 sulfur transfer protein involved in thiamine biosynthesis [Clostridium sp. SY8519]